MASIIENCFYFPFNFSLKGKNKVLLRNLSMVMRQFETVDTEEKVKVIEESVEKAKEAVGLDIKDGTSWCKYSLNMEKIQYVFVNTTIN